MKRERLRPAQRLTRRAEFERAYKAGSRVATRLFVAYVLARSEPLLRVGVVASRRVGCAVRRNRAKRLLREVFRRNQPEAAAADVVLIASRALADASYREAENVYVERVLGVLERTSRGSR